MVGSLARINMSHGKLNPIAKGIWNSFKQKMPCYNSFFNCLAQAVEIIHAFEELQKLLPKYLKIKNPDLLVSFKPKAGTGVGVIEAPRGTLIHFYELNNDGVVVYGNIITPTAMFLANLESDLKHLLPEVKNWQEEKQKAMIRTLVRAYDPCISCATH
jgi:coenzyme F420-reducing hydrogenase alpha subunit